MGGIDTLDLQEIRYGYLGAILPGSMVSLSVIEKIVSGGYTGSTGVIVRHIDTPPGSLNSTKQLVCGQRDLQTLVGAYGVIEAEKLVGERIVSVESNGSLVGLIPVGYRPPNTSLPNF